MLKLTKDEPPDCYGQNGEPNEVMCAGGRDPAYIHPIRKDHIRDSCDYFQSCITRTQAGRTQLIPNQNLARNQAGQPVQVVQQPGQPPVQVVVPPPVQMGYQQMMPVNYQMPGYLTTPEDPTQNSFWMRTLFYTLRSMAKGVFHTLAHVADSEPLGQTAPPQLPQAPPTPEKK